MVSDLVVVKTRQLRIQGEENLEKVLSRMEDGADVMDLYDEFNPGYRHDLEANSWLPIAQAGKADWSYLFLEGSISGFSDYDRNVKKGQILGPRKGRDDTYWFIQIVDRLQMDRVTLKEGIPGEPEFLRKRIVRKLESGRFPALKRKLREAVDVRVNGERVIADTRTYLCGLYVPTVGVGF